MKRFKKFNDDTREGVKTYVRNCDKACKVLLQ